VSTDDSFTLTALCQRCHTSIRETGDAVAVREVAGRCADGGAVYRWIGPFHSACAKEHQADKAAGASQ